MKRTNVCISEAEISLLLSNDLPPDETAVAELHIAECENCRSIIESMIADSTWWDDARHSLAASAVRSLLHQAEVVRDAEPATTEQILDLLGPTDDPNMLGRIGPYEIIGLLGQGGMGAVFKGFDRSLNRFVAIKMLLPHLAASGAARKRFAREGQAVAAVVDDHVMAIHSVDEWQGVPYLVMTYSRGVSLQKRLGDNGPLEVREILRIGMQAAKGLAAAHAQGIVHRDIKPANIFLDQNVERVQLMDFGLARAVDDASLTRSGTLAGTPQYMSPEQARAETVDHRSDLFSLGSVMYAMCTGHAPFRAESSYSVLRLITDKEPRPIREANPDVPEWLCSVINKLMAKQASDRFPSAKEIADILETCLAHVQQPSAMPLPEAVTALAPKRTRRPPIGKLIAAAAAGAFAMLFAGILIVLELDKSTLTIESEIDDVPIRIMQGADVAKTMKVTKGDTSVRIASGTYVVEIDGEFNGIEVKDGQVTLDRRGEKVVRILQSVDESNDAQTDSTMMPEKVRHLMEHIANPAMDDLLNAMNVKPAARRDWETIKSKSLTISEVGSLLMQRGKRDQPEWTAFSESLRGHGKSLFEASQSQDTALAKTSLAAISESCTNCHRVFRNPPNASSNPIGPLEKVGDPRNSSSSSPSHFTQRTLVDEPKRVQQISVDGESVSNQQLVLRIEETNHNKQLVWTTKIKQGTFRASMTKDHFPISERKTVPRFWFYVWHGRDGVDAESETFQYKLSASSSLPDAIIYFDKVKAAECELRGDVPVDSLRVATVKFPDGTAAAMLLSIRATSANTTTGASAQRTKPRYDVNQLETASDPVAPTSSEDNQYLVWEDDSRVRLSHWFAKAVRADDETLKSINQLLSETWTKYIELESQHTTYSRNSERLIADVSEFPDARQLLEGDFWTRLDEVVSGEQRARLHAISTARGDVNGDDTWPYRPQAYPSVIGWHEKRFPVQVELWTKGTWFYWRVSASKHTISGDGQKLPAEFRHYWTIGNRDVDGQSVNTPVHASDSVLNTSEGSTETTKMSVTVHQTIQAELATAPTLAAAAAQFNQQSAEDRRKLFNPPIPDLTEEQLREGFREAAVKHKKDGEADVAAILDKIVQTGKMPEGAGSNLVASGFETKDEVGGVETRQIVPGLIVQRDDSSHRLGETVNVVSFAGYFRDVGKPMLIEKRERSLIGLLDRGLSTQFVDLAGASLACLGGGNK